MLVAKGVHRFKLPITDVPLDGVNVYLIEGSEGSLLIDTGWDKPGVFDKICHDIEADGLKVKDIAQIVVTHVHVDHYGLAGKFKQLTGARVLTHPAEEALVMGRYEDMDLLLEKVASWLRRNGVPEEDTPSMRDASLSMRKWAAITHADGKIDDDDIVSTGAAELRAIWTPGHAPGHICLFDARNRMLFTGDHVLPEISPHVGINPQNTANPLADYLASLAKVRDLPVDMVFPAHGEPFSGLRQRVEELLHHHEERQSDIVRALGGQSQTVYEIGTKMVWMKDLGGWPFSRLSWLDKRLAIMEALAHLEMMVGEGQVRKLKDNGQVKFALAR